jgi:hypothetical protein
MKPDPGRIETDKKLAEIERKVKRVYTDAEKDLRKKMDEYFKSFESKDKRKLDQLRRGVITQEEYRKWRFGQLAVGARWQEMLNSVSADLANYQKIAKSIVNGYMPEVYCINANYVNYDIENRLRIETSFSLYSREAVEYILRDEPELLAPPGTQMLDKIATGRAIKWEKGQIQSAVTQAILQGESNPNLATRIAKDLCVSDRKSAIRYARTATTFAENAGRDDSFHRLAGLGIKLKKQWIATLDVRTREAHRELDGQSVPLDKPFKNSLGKIMRPGDPTCRIGAQIWNCRCGMIADLEGFENDASDLSLRNTSKMEGMSYEEWKRGKMKAQDIETPDKIAKIMRARYAREYAK